jgi:hypothetical protein
MKIIGNALFKVSYQEVRYFIFRDDSNQDLSPLSFMVYVKNCLTLWLMERGGTLLQMPPSFFTVSPSH